MDPGANLHTDDIELYSTRFGDDLDDRELTLNVVFWQRGEREVETPNGTKTVPAAVNQSVRTYSVSLSPGYDVANISLPSHYDKSWELTMWLTSDGERISGAQWRANHQTVASAAPVSINSFGDLAFWLGENVMLIAIPGLLISAGGTRKLVEWAGDGPNKGVVWWAIVTGVIIAGVVSFAWFRTAQLFYRLPQVFGALIVFIGAVAMLETMGPPNRKAQFVRDELREIDSPIGENLMGLVKKDEKRIKTVKRDDGKIGLIKPGILPFLARVFAEPATLTESDLKTEVEFETGQTDKQYVAKPDADQPVEWRAAHWEFDPEFLREKTDETSEGITGLLERINFTLIAVTVIAGVIGHFAGQYLFNGAPILTAAGFIGGFVAASFRARPGQADFDAAPIHYKNARATIAAKGAKFSEGETIEELQLIAHEAQSSTAMDALEYVKARDETMSREITTEELGFDPAKIGLEADGADTNGHKDDNGDESAAAGSRSDLGFQGIIDPENDPEEDER